LLPSFIAIGLGVVGIVNPRDILNKVIAAAFKKFNIDLEAILGAYNN